LPWGIFGRLPHRQKRQTPGEFSLEEMATGPLVASIRIMAIKRAALQRKHQPLQGSRH